jgi:quinol monooxygenase YgiN
MTEAAMPLDTIARFHAQSGQEDVVAAAMREQLPLARGEPGCLGCEFFRSTRDPGLFYVHSRWADEAAFELHAGLPHTVRFLAQVEPALDHELQVSRLRPVG